MKLSVSSTLFVLPLFLLLFVATVKCYSGNDDSLKYRSPSLIMKTELVKTLQLNPNLYFEYKTKGSWGFNLGLIYHLTGTIFSAPYRWSQSYSAIEWWTLKGTGVDAGLKYFTSPRKYVSLKCEAGNLSFSNATLTISERNEDTRDESLSRNFIHIILIRGKEFRKNSSFKELFWGIGLLSARENYSYHYSDPWGHPYEENTGKRKYLVPTFHLGFNLGPAFYLNKK